MPEIKCTRAASDHQKQGQGSSTKTLCEGFCCGGAALEHLRGPRQVCRRCDVSKRLWLPFLSRKCSNHMHIFVLLLLLLNKHQMFFRIQQPHKLLVWSHVGAISASMCGWNVGIDVCHMSARINRTELNPNGGFSDVHVSARQTSLITPTQLQLHVYLLSEGFCVWISHKQWMTRWVPHVQKLNYPEFLLASIMKIKSISLDSAGGDINRHVSGSDLWRRWKSLEPKRGPGLLTCWLKKDKAGDRLPLIRSGCYWKSQVLFFFSLMGKCLDHVVRFGVAQRVTAREEKRLSEDLWTVNNPAVFWGSYETGLIRHIYHDFFSAFYDGGFLP